MEDDNNNNNINKGHTSKECGYKTVIIDIHTLKYN